MALPFASLLEGMDNVLYLIYGTDCEFYVKVKEC